jgi:hypothetical protein
MINDLKEDSNKQINETKKSIQDLDKKSNNLDEKFSRDRNAESKSKPKS